MTYGRLIGVALGLLLAASPAVAERVRVATFNVELSRDGPGLLLHELSGKPGARALAAVRIIQRVRPDVLLIQKFDHDLRGRALDAFRALLRDGPEGIDYPHAFSEPVNAGEPSGLDLDGDGLLMGWEDAFGFGKYPGHGGMAVLSRHPIDARAARTFRLLPWRDLPGAVLPVRPDGGPFPDAEAQAAMRLSSRSHWDVPVLLPGGARLHVLASHPTPPLFDGPEGANRLRNRDEIGFWLRYLDGEPVIDDAGRAAALGDAPVVLMGDLNADPSDGAGLRDGVARLLAHPRLQDIVPESRGAALAAVAQGGANAGHAGEAARDTADWRDLDGPGNLRVDYVLPGAEVHVAGAGVFWPAPDAPDAGLLADASPHRLVWADLELP